MKFFENSDADAEAEPTTTKVAVAKPEPFDLSDPAERRRASWHYHLQDHAILRYHWSNLDQIAPGVWRSNQPTHDRFAKYKAMGIKTILNLRGAARQPRYLFEQESCEMLGLTLVTVGLRARLAPEKHQVVALFDVFATIDRPFLMHCKSGADRAGFAAALYVLAWEGATVEQARKQLSWRYLHFKASKTGILDHILDLYAADQAKSGIGVVDWFRNVYDTDAAMASFRK